VTPKRCSKRITGSEAATRKIPNASYHNEKVAGASYQNGQRLRLRGSSRSWCREDSRESYAYGLVSTTKIQACGSYQGFSLKPCTAAGSQRLPLSAARTLEYYKPSLGEVDKIAWYGCHGSDVLGEDASSTSMTRQEGGDDVDRSDQVMARAGSSESGCDLLGVETCGFDM